MIIAAATLLLLSQRSLGQEQIRTFFRGGHRHNRRTTVNLTDGTNSLGDFFNIAETILNETLGDFSPSPNFTDPLFGANDINFTDPLFGGNESTLGEWLGGINWTGGLDFGNEFNQIWNDTLEEFPPSFNDTNYLFGGANESILGGWIGDINVTGELENIGDEFKNIFNDSAFPDDHNNTGGDFNNSIFGDFGNMFNQILNQTFGDFPHSFNDSYHFFGGANESILGGLLGGINVTGELESIGNTFKNMFNGTAFPNLNNNNASGAFNDSFLGDFGNEFNQILNGTLGDFPPSFNDTHHFFGGANESILGGWLGDINVTGELENMGNEFKNMFNESAFPHHRHNSSGKSNESEWTHDFHGTGWGNRFNHSFNDTAFHNHTGDGNNATHHRKKYTGLFGFGLLHFNW